MHGKNGGCRIPTSMKANSWYDGLYPSTQPELSQAKKYLSISDTVMPRTDNPEHNNKTNPVTEDESSMSAFNYNLASRKWAASTTSSEEQKYVKYAIKALKLNTETTNRLRGAWEYEGENWSYATKSKQMACCMPCDRKRKRNDGWTGALLMQLHAENESFQQLVKKRYPRKKLLFLKSSVKQLPLHPIFRENSTSTRFDFCCVTAATMLLLLTPCGSRFTLGSMQSIEMKALKCSLFITWHP